MAGANGLKAQMTHLKEPVQKPVVDGKGSTDDSVSEEEGSEGGEHSVGHGNGPVDRQVKLDIPVHVLEEKSVHRGHRRPDVNNRSQ